MFGAFLRGASYLLFGWLFTLVLGMVLEPLLEAMAGGSAQAKGTLLYDSLASLNENALLVVIVGALFGLLAAAVVESQTGVAR
jgi:uncharacterized membrane protein YeaQ/YmgE (transglycosylase-associated protein family)